MRIISVLNQKGGVAKTTSAQNISYGLEKLGKRVLLIDLDPQGNLTTGVGVNKHEVEYTIYDLMRESALGKKEIKLKDVIQEVSGVDVLPANIKMSKFNSELGGIPGKETILKDILKRVRDYDYVIIDCPPSLDSLTYNALIASDKVYIPVQAEFYALEGIQELLDTIEMIKVRLNPELEIGGVFITMFDSRIKLHKEVSDQIEIFFEDKFLQTKIARNIKVAEAASHGKSIYEYSKTSVGAKSYRELAKEIDKREGGKNGK